MRTTPGISSVYKGAPGIIWLTAASLLVALSACRSQENPREVEACPATAGKLQATPVSITQPDGFLHVELLDRNRWFVGGFERLWKSEDAGLNWRISFERKPGGDEEQYLRGLSFVDDSLGFLIDRSTVYRTNDGGGSWTQVGTIGGAGSEYFINNCRFVDSRRGWAVGLRWTVGFEGAILRTNDGGASWHQQAVDLPTFFEGDPQRWSLRDIWFVNHQTGWIVGDGIIFHTSNGGRTWRAIHIEIDDFDDSHESVRLFDRFHGWVTSREQADFLYTNDGGLHWRMVRGPDSNMIMTIAPVFVTEKRGFAVLGGLYETINSGTSWKRRSLGKQADQQEYGYLGRARDGTIVAFSMGDRIVSVKSFDDGRTWSSNRF